MNKVCHCNVKENAELIAKILDCDVSGATFVFKEIADPFKPLHTYVTELRETLQEEKDSFYQLWKEEEDSDKRFRLTMAMGVQKKCLSMFDDILFYLETGEPPYCDCAKLPKGGDK